MHYASPTNIGVTPQFDLGLQKTKVCRSHLELFKKIPEEVLNQDPYLTNATDQVRYIGFQV